MRILSAGMHRSGSTWLYNALRLIMESKVEGDYIKGFVSGNDTPFDVKNAVIKIHVINPDYIEWADKIFYIYRDIRDVVASYVRWRGIPMAEEGIDADIKAGIEYMWKAHMSIEYNQIIKEPEKLLFKMGYHLSTKIKPKSILIELEKIKNKKLKNTDPITLMRVGHITDGRSNNYKEYLEPEYLSRIEDKYGWWLKQNEYWRD